MKLMSQAKTQLSAMKTAVNNKINSLSSLTLTSTDKTQLKAWYANKIDNVISAINNFGSSMFAAYYIQADIYDLVTIAVQYLTMNPDVIENLWDTLDEQHIFTAIKNCTINDIYIGTNVDSHPLLDGWKNTLTQESQQLHNNLQNLHSRLMSSYMPFNLEYFLEEKPLLPPEGWEDFPGVKYCATKLYNDWDLKDIISELNLEIYIPTYVR